MCIRDSHPPQAAVLKEIVAETGKAEEDVRRYYATFWERHEARLTWRPLDSLCVKI